MLSYSPASWLMYPHAVSCLSWGTLRNLSKLVCLVTSKLENKHFGKDYFSVTVHRSYQALLKLTDTSVKRIATYPPHVQASVLLDHSNLSAKGFSFQLQLTRKLSTAPCLRCCVETTEATHKIMQHQHNFPPITLSSWASTLFWTFLDVTELYCNWPKGNSPGDVRNQKLHQLPSKPCPA